jgi:hypothetical protein
MLQSNFSNIVTHNEQTSQNPKDGKHSHKSHQYHMGYDKNVLSKKIKETYALQQANEEIKKRLRSSHINVNSTDRSVVYTFQYFSSTNLIANPILFSGTNKVIIYHPNNNLDVRKSYDLIITGIVGDTVNGVVQDTICNYPINLINFDVDNPTNIFTINRFTEIVKDDGHFTVEDNYVYEKSDYYQIELKNILTEENNIRSGYVGGSSINVKIIKRQNDVFVKPNHYKVQLARTYRNVVAVRLVSTEIPNISYTVNINNSNSRNNRLQWINEDEKLTITDKVLVTDHVLLNSLDHNNYINSEHIKSNPGQGSDSDGSFTLSDLANLPINSNPSINQTAHASAVIRDINADDDKQTSYRLLTNTPDLDNSDPVIVNSAGVDVFKDKETIRDNYRQNRYFTPKKMFMSSYFFENNYHSFGKTLVAHIRSLINLKTEPVVKQALPWEYNYYKIYTSRGREKYLGTNKIWNASDNTHPLKYLGYQIFDNLLSTTIGYSDVKFPATSTLTTETRTVTNTTIPKNILYGTELIPQDPRDTIGISTINEIDVYPVHNIFLEEGIFNIQQLMDLISTKMNTDDILYFDWKIRDWRKTLTPSNKYILYNNNRKSIFELRYDFGNSVITFTQYKIIPYQNSIANLPVNEKSEEGDPGLYFVVNEGYPHICIVNEGHLFKNGNFVKIANSNSIFNINQDRINQLHNAIVNPVYKIHVRSIFPIPMKSYFRVANANIDSATADKLAIHQIDSSNISTTYDRNTPDANYKILAELYGSDILNFLNKGTVNNMLNYIGSKLSQNLQDQNATYPPSTTETYTKFKNHVTETVEETIHNPESPFMENELFMKYSHALGEGHTLSLGRVVKRSEFTDEHGNIEIDFELLTERSRNFTIGDVIVGMESNAIAMIVPYYWNEARFPTKAELDAGYREYLITKNNFNTHVPNFYWSIDGSKNKDDNSLDKKWYLQRVYNGEISYSIDVDTVPNSSNINGIENNEVEVMTPVKFSMLFGLDNTIGQRLGFKSNKEGVLDKTISSDKISVNFQNTYSNTVKSDEITIKSTKFVKLYDNKWSNYLMIECYDKIPYNKGDRVYFENHVINNYLEENYRSEELLIKQIYPLKDWYYSIESRYINNVLSNGKTSLPSNPFILTNGSNEISVTLNEHGFSVGDKITFEGATEIIAGRVTAANLNVTTTIIRINTINSFVITPTIDATPNATTTGGGSSVKITIDYPDVTLGTNPFAVTNGSPIITVTHTAHGLLAGDIITISGATDLLASKVVASDVNTTTPITSIVNANSYTISPLITAVPDSTVAAAGGSAVVVSHNSAAGAMHRKIENMRIWFYQNVHRWTNYDIDYRNFITRNYLYPRVLHGETQTIIHVSKIYVKESTGDAKTSSVFIPGMTITHDSSTIGLKVLGITTIKHNTDRLYNEEPIRDIDEISNGNYYYIYFQRLSTVSLSGLDAGESVTYTDGSGSTNLRNASATLVTIPGSSISYVEDAAIDYLHYFYLADKTILQYRTPITKEEQHYIEANNINVTDEHLKMNPFSGSDDFPLVAKLSTDPNNNDIEYGQTVSGTTANAGPFYVTENSPTIRVTHPYHGLSEGDEITITGATTIIANKVTAYNLNVTTPVTKVIDETYYNIAPSLTANPGSGETQYGGGALVKIEYTPSTVDVNVNAIPITTLQTGDNVYITNHQKLIPKYYEEDDVIETNESYMNKLKSNYNDEQTDAMVDNKLTTHVAGIKNGAYKVLTNLWAGPKTNNYFMQKYWPGRTVLTDIDWTDEVAEGFLNQGGKMRIKTRPYHIIGDNNYTQCITDRLKKDFVADDLQYELYSVLGVAVTGTTASEVTTIIVKHGVNFRVGGVVIIDPIIYSQHTESTANHSQQNTITEMNLITAITEITDESDSNFGSYILTLQFRLLNDHALNSYVVQKAYATTLSSSAAANGSTIEVTDPNYFVVGDIITIGWNSYSGTEGDVGYYRELRNRVTQKSGSTLTLQNTLIQTYTSGTYVFKLAPTILDNNIVRHNYLATQNILVRGEWYTKIFYQGPEMMEDITAKNGEYTEGANAFNKYTQKDVYISGMKGMSLPQLSFDNYSEYVTERATLNSVTTKTSYNIEQTVPVPDGFYKLYPNIEQDGRQYLWTDDFNLPIKGGFYVQNKTPHEKELYWRDTGFSRQETLSSNSSSLQIGTTGVFGTEINVGERNESQHIQAPTPTVGEQYGNSLDISGSYLAVGTKLTTDGNVYVYYKNQATGVYALQKTITIPATLSGLASSFGEFIAITQNYLAISAIGQYRMYLYKRVGTNWEQLKVWNTVSDYSITTTHFGRRPSLNGNYLLFGSSAANSTGNRAYLHEKNTGGTDNWGLIKTFTYPGSNDTDNVSTNNTEQFGFSTHIDGDYIVISANKAHGWNGSSEINDCGLVYVYYKHQNGRDQWGRQATLFAQLTNGTNNMSADAHFGDRCDIRGKYVLSGAPDMDDTATNDGSAYMYFRTGTQWTIQQKLVPSTRVTNENFGGAVRISPCSSYCVIASRFGSKVHVFLRSGTTWTESSILEHSSPITNDRFGFEMSYDGLNVLVGANGSNATGEKSKGSVFVFNQLYTKTDGSGVIAVDDHTTHELYLDGVKQQLSVDYSFTNDTTIAATTTTLANNPITTTNTSATITIAHTGHGLIAGDYITISGATTTNNITAAQINITTSIVSVTNRDSYTVTLPAGTANANGAGGGASVAIQNAFTTNTVVEHSIDGWRKIYETGRNFNCVVIKGKYIGHGGQIQFRDKENILEHPNGYEVKQIIYTDDNPLLPSNKFFIDLQKYQTDFISSSDISVYVPSSSLYKNLTLLESNNLFIDNHIIGTSGSVFKRVRDAPVNIENDYINMCIIGFGTIQNTSTNTINDIFAKILLPSGSGSIYYDTFTSTPKEFYDKPVRELSEIEIKFVDNNGELVEFNGYDHSFTLEIIELDEELFKINSQTGQVE